MIAQAMKTHEPLPPFERIYDLNRLSDAGFETTIELGPEERRKLAEWVEVADVGRFVGRISLRRLSASRFGYSAHLEAEITQTCAVTLEPVSSKQCMDFDRILQLVPQARRATDTHVELSPAAGDDEVPEEIESSRYDLAAPLLEEFSLAIDPYPRAPGASFEAPREEGEAPDNPFAVLKTLKSKG